jgi:hypothetical protein
VRSVRLCLSTCIYIFREIFASEGVSHDFVRINDSLVVAFPGINSL